MYLRQLPKNQSGKTLLVLTQSVREGQRIVKETVEQLGYLEDLTGSESGQYPDPVAHFKAYAKRRTLEEKQGKQKVTLSYQANEPIPAGGGNRKSIGYMLFSQIYEKLGISRFMANRQRNLDIEYSLNSVFKLLVFSRLLLPGSKKAAFENRESFFEKFDFSIDDVYRSLDLLNRYADDLKVFLHKNVGQLYGRETDLVFYDVTNFYFEIEKQDELRKKGVCKEHRPNPIVQMGLLMDKQSLPISYEMFSGNTNDCETLMPILQKVRRDFDIGRFIVVADRGLNTSNNTGMALAKGDGYIYGQSILRASSQMKDYCLKEDGYTTCKENDSGFKIKSRIAPRTITVEDVNGKAVDVPIDEKQVFFYSEKYAERTRAQRQEVLDKAVQLISSPGQFMTASLQGVKKYIKGLQVDPKTGEILSAKQKLFLDESKIADEAQYDGYYAVVTSELDMPDKQVIDHYRELWQIEESFRLTKSDLQARPVFVSTKDHINAHFLTCFVSLLLLRLVQLQTKNAYPVGQLLEAIRNMNGTVLPNNEYIFDHYSEVVKALGDAFQVDFNRRFLNKNEIMKMRSPD